MRRQARSVQVGDHVACSSGQGPGRVVSKRNLSQGTVRIITHQGDAMELGRTETIEIIGGTI